MIGLADKRNGHLVYFGNNKKEFFSNFMDAYHFAINRDDFIKYEEMKNGELTYVVESKEKLGSYFWIYLQLN